MSKISLVNADDAIKSYIKYSSLSQGIYQGLVAKPHEIAKLIKIAVDPQRQGIIQTHCPLVVCQILQNYPYLLLVLFSVQKNANCLFDFMNYKPNPTQWGYFSRIVSLFNSSTQQEALRFLKQNNKILSLCYSQINISSVFRFLFDCTILCKKQYEIRSVILIKLYKQIIIQPTQQLAQSIKDTLTQLIQNYNILGNTVKQTLCNIFDEQYIKEIIELIIKSSDYYISEFCASIINKIIVIYFFIKKQVLALQLLPEEANKQSKQNNNNDPSKIKIDHIDKGITQILKHLPQLLNILSSEPISFHTDQLSQTVPNITAIKFKLSQLFKTIVKHFDLDQLIKYGLNIIQLLKDVIKVININPWANLIHNQLTEIALTLIEKQNNWQQNIIDVLNLLMDLFKNRYYIFLNSGITKNQGNTHHLYLIIKKLSVQLDNSQQLQNIFNKCKAWKKFLIQDIRKYEQGIKSDPQLYPKNQESQKDNTIGNLIVKINQRNSNCLINQFITDLDDSYVSVKDYTVWDKRKQSR